MAQRSLHVITKVYYRSYDRLSLGSHGTLTMLRFPRVVRGTTAPLAPYGPGRIYHANPQTSEQDTQHITFLISK
jgi:hypothetical protein